MGFNKPCLVCGVLSRGTRCPEHQAELNRKKEQHRVETPERKAKKRLLYNNPQYQAARKQLLATATHCHICKKAFTPSDKIEADHLIPGHPMSPLAPAHRLCNQRRGNKPLITG